MMPVLRPQHGKNSKLKGGFQGGSARKKMTLSTFRSAFRWLKKIVKRQKYNRSSIIYYKSTILLVFLLKHREHKIIGPFSSNTDIKMKMYSFLCALCHQTRFILRANYKLCSCVVVQVETNL